MLRIGLLIDTLTGGGAERIVLNFAEGFAQRGTDVHIILVRNEMVYDVEQAAFGIHWLSEDGRLSKSRWMNKLRLSKRLQGLVRKIESDGKKFDFFISNAEDMDRLSQTAKLDNVYIRYRNSLKKYMESKVGKKTGLKKIIRQIRWRKKFIRIYSNVNIITVSNALRHEMMNDIGIKPKSITTIYNPFDFSKLRERAQEKIDHKKFPQAEPYIIYVAKLENRKRQDILLRALAKLNIPHKLVLLGGVFTASDKRWREHIISLGHKLGIGERIILPGFQQNPYPWIKRADLFAMSSDSEGLPTVLIESLIIGTPVVSTNCPTGPAEILTGELAQFLSEPGKAEPLAQNIQRALSGYPKIPEHQLAPFSIDYSLDQYIRHCVKTA